MFEMFVNSVAVIAFFARSVAGPKMMVGRHEIVFDRCSALSSSRRGAIAVPTLILVTKNLLFRIHAFNIDEMKEDVLVAPGVIGRLGRSLPLSVHRGATVLGLRKYDD